MEHLKIIGSEEKKFVMTRHALLVYPRMDQIPTVAVQWRLNTPVSSTQPQLVKWKQDMKCYNYVQVAMNPYLDYPQ